MTASPVRRLADWTGRWLLLGAVAFWWGVIVVPRLFSLAFPTLLSPGAIPRHLNPEIEGSLANAVSAIFLQIVVLLALANAVRSFGSAQDRPLGRFRKLTASRLRTQDKRIAVLGWATLAVTAAYLVWEEFSDFHITGLTVVEQAVFGKDLVQAAGTSIWPVLLSPLIVGFVIAMWLFVHKGLSAWAVRAPLILGFAAWLLAVAHEASYPFLFTGRAEMLEIVVEETLEFSGTLLVGLGAGIALGSKAVSRPLRGAFQGRPLKLLAGSTAAVAVLGGLVLAFTFRAPVIDARAVYIDTFELSLRDGEAIVQELQMPAYPVGGFRVRAANRDPEGRSGIARMRITETGTSEPILAEGFVEVPARDSPVWRDIELVPPLAEAQGRSLAVQLAADVEREAHLRIGATQTDQYPDGRLWINGALAWPDQDLEFVAYSAPELTRSKLGAMSDIFTSDWRWPVLLADLAVVLTLITFIPALLVTAALPRRGLP